jgi:hypothetical protein
MKRFKYFAIFYKGMNKPYLFLFILSLLIFTVSSKTIITEEGVVSDGNVSSNYYTNKTFCSQIQGATSNLCTIVDSGAGKTYLSNFTNNLNFLNQTTADLIYLNLSGTNANQNINISPYNITVGTLFADFLGSLTNRIREVWVTNINSNGNVSFTGTNFEINSTQTTVNGNFTSTGEFETTCLHCEDGDSYFHGEGIFAGNVTAPNIEVMESLIVHGNSTCTGTANTCGDALFIGNPFLCGWTIYTGQRGCRWQWSTGTCVGTATACADMPTSTCEEQHTCTLTSSTGFIFGAGGFEGNVTFHDNVTILNNLDVGGNGSFDWVNAKNLNVTGTSYLGSITIKADNITAGYFFGSGANLHSVNFTETDPKFIAENASLWNEAKNKYNATYAQWAYNQSGSTNNNTIGNVNSSTYADIWITSTGNKNNANDILFSQLGCSSIDVSSCGGDFFTIAGDVSGYDFTFSHELYGSKWKSGTTGNAYISMGPNDVAVQAQDELDITSVEDDTIISSGSYLSIDGVFGVGSSSKWDILGSDDDMFDVGNVHNVFRVDTLNDIVYVNGTLNIKDNIIIGGNVTLLNTVWDDLTFPMSNVRKNPTTSLPHEDETNIFYLFDDASTETVYGVGQTSHSQKNNTPLSCHIHWVQSATGNVNWTLNYTLNNVGQTSGEVWRTLSSVTGMYAWSSGNLEQLTDLPDTINIGGIGLSSIFRFKVSRVGGDSSDTMTGDAKFESFDCHYPKDQIGSNEEFVK